MKNDQNINSVNLDFSVDDALVMIILELAAKLTQNGNIITQQAGITTQQWLILLYIAQDPNIPFLEEKNSENGMFASDIAQALNVSRANVANMINALISKGLISQDVSNDDRRRRTLSITSEGCKALEMIQSYRKTANKGFFKEVKPSHKNLLHQTLKELLGKLKQLD